ncbi:MAG: KH domain-containing protein [Tenericutes bacterium]|jgi:hypothetical protein|nr:KH domain-containing protein [Bacilli bacterium]MDD4624369.1 KH domain-containing protein [Bacilli bacterium]MDD4831868.1 KH domain-containing protein [Bacilli bacterium]NLV90317.1 KH domain-containing protein [Mycoplasmatota bacterium]
MNLVELTETLIKAIVKDPDSVSVKQFETEDDSIQIEVLVDSESIGAVIGKNGKIAKAIRTIVRASSYLDQNKKVTINIDSI